MKRRLVFLVLLLSSCSTSSAGPTVTPPPHIEAEEYAVYSALVRQNPIGIDLGTSFVVREQTVSGLDLLESTLEHHKLPGSLVDSYRSRNAMVYTLSPNLDIEQAYTMLPQVEFERIFLHTKGSVWTPFQEAYPEAGGMIAFSRVGFDQEGEKALAQFGFRCGDLCGAGGLYLLSKDNGNWVVQEALMIWQS